MSNPAIGFAGLGHLGLCSAAAAAEKGFAVAGYDPDARVVEAALSGAPRFHEPGLGDLIERNRERLALSSGPESLANCDVVFVAHDTPTDESGLS
ncbi:MAG: GDP-mannose dehydrogenase, partial [Alphaproteobacteria bacterium]